MTQSEQTKRLLALLKIWMNRISSEEIVGEFITTAARIDAIEAHLAEGKAGKASELDNVVFQPNRPPRCKCGAIGLVESAIHGWQCWWCFGESTRHIPKVTVTNDPSPKPATANATMEQLRMLIRLGIGAATKDRDHAEYLHKQVDAGVYDHAIKDFCGPARSEAEIRIEAMEEVRNKLISQGWGESVDALVRGTDPIECIDNLILRERRKASP